MTATSTRADFLNQRQNHGARFTTAIHAFGPPSLNTKSFISGRTSNRDGAILATTQPSAKAISISLRVTRLGPCVPGSSSLKQRRKNRPPALRTDANPSTYFFRSSSEKTWNSPQSITLSKRSDQSLSVVASLTTKATDKPRSAALCLARRIGSSRKSMPVTAQPRPAKNRALSPVPQPASRSAAADLAGYVAKCLLRSANIPGGLTGVGRLESIAVRYGHGCSPMVFGTIFICQMAHTSQSA